MEHNEHYPYSVRETRHTRAIERIWNAEENGDLEAGSVDDALDSIGNGGFILRWGKYLY